MGLSQRGVRSHCAFGLWACSDPPGAMLKTRILRTIAFSRLSAIQRMTSINPQQHFRYIDASELAAILGLSLRTITLRAKHRPWLLPPRVELYDCELLRWRQDVVAKWLSDLQKPA